MGRRGSDVAKEAAVVVGTDDNFASIVGRHPPGPGRIRQHGEVRHRHLRVERVGVFVFRILLPMTAMQIRAVDFVPALALAEKPVLNGRHVLTTVHPAAVMRFPCSAAAFCATFTRCGRGSASVSERRDWRGAVPWGHEGPCVQDLATRRQLTRSDICRSGPGPGFRC
jgi:hypothetical protein